MAESSPLEAAAMSDDHLIFDTMRRYPDGEVRVYSAEGRLIAGTWCYQAVETVDRLRAIAAYKAEQTTPDPRDLHARWHDMPGNLMGRDDCGWEGCEFYSIAVFVLAGGAVSDDLD